MEAAKLVNLTLTAEGQGPWAVESTMNLGPRGQERVYNDLLLIVRPLRATVLHQEVSLWMRATYQNSCRIEDSMLYKKKL